MLQAWNIKFLFALKQFTGFEISWLYFVYLSINLGGTVQYTRVPSLSWSPDHLQSGLDKVYRGDQWGGGSSSQWSRQEYWERSVVTSIIRQERFDVRVAGEVESAEGDISDEAGRGCLVNISNTWELFFTSHVEK